MDLKGANFWVKIPVFGDLLKKFLIISICFGLHVNLSLTLYYLIIIVITVITIIIIIIIKKIAVLLNMNIFKFWIFDISCK